MNNPKADLDYYGLFYHREEFVTDQTGQLSTIIQLRNKLGAIDFSDVKLAQFKKDMTLMNLVRSSSDPTVLDAFEQLLTVMALTYKPTNNK